MTTLLVVVVFGGLVVWEIYSELLRYRNNGVWQARAEKLARDNELPTRVDTLGEVARYLRWQHVANGVWFCAVAAVLWSVEVVEPTAPATVVAAMLLGALPISAASAVVTCMRGWNRAGGGRTARLTRPTCANVLTVPERAVVCVEAIFAVFGGASALWARGHVVLMVGWLVAAAGLGAIGFWALARVVNRPSRARDDLELAWDDMFRFRESRELLAVTVGWPAAVALLVVLAPILSRGNIVPLYAVAAGGLLHWAIFRRGRGLWRQWGGHLAT